MSIAIKVENISKAYQLGLIGTGTISRDIERWVANMRGKEDPFLKIGQENDRTKKGETNIVWSLKDVSFEIEQGKAVGIIGRNGAGKSTLLKLLSRVTAPTTGTIKVKGRIASLLEVGTGFHPELTGKENIYLNGAILGMRKKEIDRKFDEIVDFSGVNRYINTPVKRYSSGMYVRLAFAVAAHLESEILVVDEVLAVGDAEFQTKCLGKMGDVTNKEGRTVLFVSHNMGAIKNLCESSILMDMGRVKMIGTTDTVIERYLNNNSVENRQIVWDENKKPGDENVQLNSIRILNNHLTCEGLLTSDIDIYIETAYEILKEIRDLRVVAEILHSDGTIIFSTSDFYFQDRDRLRTPGKYISRLKIPKNIFNAGMYYVSIHFEIPKTKNFIQDVTIGFSIDELINNNMGPTFKPNPQGLLHLDLGWEVIKQTNLK